MRIMSTVLASLATTALFVPVVAYASNDSSVIDALAGISLAEWDDVEVGAGRLPEIRVNLLAYPDLEGVQFLINGEVDDRFPRARPDGFDATGPLHDSTFHVFPKIELKSGDQIEARWTDLRGVSRSAIHVVVDPRATEPVDYRIADMNSARWVDVEPGDLRLPVIRIDETIYPNSNGVQFLVNDQVDERIKRARPSGFDATGPLDGSEFHIYPKINLRLGDKLEARWTSRDGIALRSLWTVGGLTGSSPSPEPVTEPPVTQPPVTQPLVTQPLVTQPPVTQPPVTQPPVTQPPVTQPPVTQPPVTQPPVTQPPVTQPPVTQPPVTQPPVTQPPVTQPPGVWPDASSTGVRRADLLRPSGSITVTTPGTIIENLDITGSITIDASNVTVRNVRVRSNGAKYLINIVSSGGHRGIVIEDCELDGRDQSTQAVVHAGYTIRRCNIHNTEDGLRASGDVVIEDNYIHDLSVNGTTWSDSPHNDGVQSIGGSNIVVRNNRIEGPYREQTSAIIFHAHLVGPLRNVLIEGNLLSGGTYTLNLKARDGQPDLGSDVVVRDNVIVKDSWKFGPLNTDRAKAVVYEGNTLSDGSPAF